MSYEKFIEEATQASVKLHSDIEKLIEAYEAKYKGMTISQISLYRKAYNFPRIDS